MSFALAKMPFRSALALILVGIVGWIVWLQPREDLPERVGTRTVYMLATFFRRGEGQETERT